MEELGQRVAKRREKLGLMQMELAERCGCSKQTISHIELGNRKPSIELLIKLSGALHCSTDSLLGINTDTTAIKIVDSFRK